MLRFRASDLHPGFQYQLARGQTYVNNHPTLYLFNFPLGRRSAEFNNYAKLQAFIFLFVSLSLDWMKENLKKRCQQRYDNEHVQERSVWSELNQGS